MRESDIQLSDIMIKMDAMYSNQEELKSEVNKIRDVVIGNGSTSSILHQVKELQFKAEISQKDRERMSAQLGKLNQCVTRLEKDGIKETNSIDGLASGQVDIIKRLDKMDAVQEEQGVLIQAFRNRVIGIVAVLSLLAGAGAGFFAAARLLEAAVP